MPRALQGKDDGNPRERICLGGKLPIYIDLLGNVTQMKMNNHIRDVSRFIFSWYNLKEIELRGEKDLVEGGAGGGEGAGGVGQDPVHLLRHPSVDTGVASGGTSISPTNNSNQSLAAVLGGNHGTTRISLAGVLSGVSGADHVGGDAVVSIAALGVGGHCDVDLVHSSGPVAPTA